MTPLFSKYFWNGRNTNLIFANKFHCFWKMLFLLKSNLVWNNQYRVYNFAKLAALQNCFNNSAYFCEIHSQNFRSWPPLGIKCTLYVRVHICSVIGATPPHTHTQDRSLSPPAKTCNCLCKQLLSNALKAWLAVSLPCNRTVLKYKKCYVFV